MYYFPPTGPSSHLLLLWEQACFRRYPHLISLPVQILLIFLYSSHIWPLPDSLSLESVLSRSLFLRLASSCQACPKVLCSVDGLHFLWVQRHILQVKINTQVNKAEMKQITIQVSVTQWARLGGLNCRPRVPLSSLTLPGSLAFPLSPGRDHLLCRDGSRWRVILSAWCWDYNRHGPALKEFPLGSQRRT